MDHDPTGAHPIPTGDLPVNIAAFRRHLRAENVSPNTVLAYVGAVEQLAGYLAAQGLPLDVARIERAHRAVHRPSVGALEASYRQ